MRVSTSANAASVDEPISSRSFGDEGLASEVGVCVNRLGFPWDVGTVLPFSLRCSGTQIVRRTSREKVNGQSTPETFRRADCVREAFRIGCAQAACKHWAAGSLVLP